MDEYLRKLQLAGCDISDGIVATMPAGWIPQFWGTRGKIRIVDGTEGKEVHSGKYALCVHGGDKGISFYQERSATAGPLYHYRFYAKGKGKVTIRIYGAGLKDEKPILGTYDVSEAWSCYEGRCEASPEGQFFSFVFNVAPETEVVLDDFELWRE